MTTVTNAIRTTSRVSKSGGITLTELPLEADTLVEIIIIPGLQAGDEISEEEWMRAAARNPVFADWADPEEDIYSLDEGVPFDEHR